ncbi:uncharacterized protein LOC113427537 [Notechis scutatus]|uniref:Uncharacterized protein LOC113427537 n=1 Tax=Notechis scutatus TaxID=8663 RepID=A0A6J1W0K3_9SAUR|nr:uncharacterized protein LOC113427537 [Notechis scutatus]XP_026545839.1 uncharacterized protein LOC113427537 [Notechis scutatus]
MDLVTGMDVGAEIEVNEYGDLDELPLRLENIQNCLCLESVDVSSSDDDGESQLTFFLPVRRPPRPYQRRSIHRPTAPAKLSASEKWIPPLFSCPLRPGGPPPPGIPAFGAYQCQKCLQVFMEEWHYTQHLQDHAQEEEQVAQLHAAQVPTRVPSPPRKLRCLECGKRFLRPEQFARHTKWHLKLVRLGIKVHHRKVSQRSSQVSYVYKPLGGTRNPPDGKEVSDLPVMQEVLSQPAGLPFARPQRTGKRKAAKHPKRKSAESWQPQELLSSTQAGNSMAVLDGATGINLLQPWQKQEGVLEGQVAGGLFQPAVMSAENQIIILDGDEAEAVPVAAERHYAELQTSVFDGQAATNAVQPVFLRTEEQAAILEAPVSTNPLQAGGVKDQEAAGPEWVDQNPCTVYRTVLLQADDQAAVVDGQAEPGPFQQVIIKTSEVSPTLYLDPQMSSLGPAAFHLVPEPQYITFPYGNSLPLDHSEATVEGEEAWESQEANFCLPNLYQASKQQQQQQPPSVATTSPRSPVVMRLLPCPTGDHPEVLDLEYDTGGGIPVASEPWDVNLHAGQETPSPSLAAEDGFIVVEMESELGQQGLVVGEHHDRPQQRTFQRARKPPLRQGSIWRFKCPDCGVCYSQHSQLRSHQKGRKRRGRSFLCECGSPFRGLLHLLRHQLRHLEEALFICSTCGKSLRGHAGLQRHNSCHPSLARFSCPCGVHFRRLSRYLWHHVRSQRPGLRVYTLAGFLSST